MQSAQVLGQLLLMQNVMSNLPNQRSIRNFVCRGLKDMPGVAEVRYFDSRQESVDVSVVRFPLLVGNSFLGELAIRVSDAEAFTPYVEYLENFCFMMAVILEERNQRHAIKRHQVELEQRVQERTKELSDEIAERKLIEEERNKLIEQLESKNAELERFAYTISHDLKTPVITLKWLLGVLREDLKEGDCEAVEASLSRADCAADRMAQLLHDVLELVRIGRVINPSEEIPAGELMREAVELTSGRIAARGVDVDVKADLCVLYGDRSRLLETLQNLLDNAVKYMGAQPKPRVEVGAYPQDGHWICYVEDNGIGIDPRYHERVFRLFEQVDPAVEGSGVGLALVKRIVEFHGGRVWLESIGLGHGSRFCFAIPEKGSA
jgi:signal transduction histidine kinase